MDHPPRHVLIVEDDRITALVMSEFLNAHGYRTSVATNGKDGVFQFFAALPALALVDAALPMMNGFDAVAEMKDSEHGTRTARPRPRAMDIPRRRDRTYRGLACTPTH